LILLDIGLPKLNGLEAARQIRNLAPESKILFLTQESSADVIQDALTLGALGYVVKAHAGTELLPAVNAVLQGKQFVSSGLPNQYFSDATDAEAPERPFYEKAHATPGPAEKEIAHNHEVQFHPDDASLLISFASFIAANLESGNAVIVVATESHRERLLHRLQVMGVEVATAFRQGRYISLDVAETLSTFMVNDLPDPVRFFKVTGDLILAAAKTAKGKSPRVSACGECAPALYLQGNAGAAIQLEHFWDEIAKTYDVDVLCGYIWDTLDRQPEGDIYERICAEHSAVRS
jgi:hypothetical protein